MREKHFFVCVGGERMTPTNGACEGGGSTEEKKVKEKGNIKACSLCVESAQGSAFHPELCMHGKKVLKSKLPKEMTTSVGA